MSFSIFYPKVYPFPKEDLEDLMARYSFDAVCFSESDLAKAEGYGIVYDIGKFKTLFINRKYRLIALPAHTEVRKDINPDQS